MLEAVESGSLARDFGPRYGDRALRQLARQMNADVSELVPGSLHFNPERVAALKSMNEKRLGIESKNGVWLNKTIFGKASIKEKFEEKAVLQLKNFVHSALYEVFAKHIPLPYRITRGLPPVNYQDKFGCDPTTDNCFEWGPWRGNGNEIEARVIVTDPTLPATQEEYLHAAQELTFGNVDGLKFLDPNIGAASGHVTHSSILLDRTLSSAAAEMGADEFGYWADKADKVTADFRRRFVRDLAAPWNRTPLGKEVNNRFRYPMVEYRELGARLINLSLDMERFLYTKDGQLIPGNEALFNIISLQFGRTHLDWVYKILDLMQIPEEDEEEIDFEEIGRRMVEWGKMVLRFYKGKLEENELVTHHTHLDRKIDLVGDEYETYVEVVRLINEDMRSKHSIPTTLINLGELAKVVYDRSLQVCKEILDACFPFDPNIYVKPDIAILKKHGLSPNAFALLVRWASESYMRHRAEKNRFDSSFNLPFGD